jgi:SAM-dependent methyltransferase
MNSSRTARSIGRALDSYNWHQMDRMLAATALAEDRHFWFRGLRRNARLVLDQALNGRTLDRIVDCGSGTGRNLDWLQVYGTAIGIERSSFGIGIGRARGRKLIQGSVTHLPLSDATVDLATSFDVLYCLDDDSERRAAREMWRVLKMGGLALVNVAALEMLHGSHSTLTHEVRRYTPARLRELLTGAGFDIVRLTFTNMATFPLTLAVRVADRLTGRVKEASDADLRVPAAPVNAVLAGALAIDAGLLRWTNLPIGTSLLCVARKTR